MSDLEKLKEELTKYYKLKESLEGIVFHLESVIEKLCLLSFNLYYEINEVNVGKNIILKQKNETVDKKNKINRQILPEIDEKIYYLKNKIQQEEILLNNIGE